MLTKEDLAARLTGREYRSEVTKAECAEAKAAGLVVIYGVSDDGVALEGAVADHVGAFDGTTVSLSRNGKLLKRFESIDKDDEDELAAYFKDKATGVVEIEALWCPEFIDGQAVAGYSWGFQTDLPHATFEIVEDGEPFCRGIVIAVADVKAGAGETPESLREKLERMTKSSINLGHLFQRNNIAMQAAVIAWHLESPENGMTWIFNTLDGPGLLPDLEAAKRLGGAQAWFNTKMAAEEARCEALGVKG